MSTALTALTNNANKHSFKMVEIDKKGLGLTATKFIKRGEVILIESALFVCTDSSKPNLVLQHIKQLDKESKKQYFALHPQSQHDPYSIYLRNNFSSQTSTRSNNTGGIWIKASRINHSCVPNAIWFIPEPNSQVALIYVVALKNINVAEEITVSYLNREMALNPYYWR
eukprot:407078_1